MLCNLSKLWATRVRYRNISLASFRHVQIAEVVESFCLRPLSRIATLIANEMTIPYGSKVIPGNSR